MKENTEISERLSQMLDFVNLNTNEFAQKLGYKRSQVLYDILNGKSKPSFDFFEKLQSSEFSEIFRLEWIVSGKGPMLRQEDLVGVREEPAMYNRQPQVITVDAHQNDNIVLVPGKLKAGYLTGFNNPKFISKLPTFRMPGLNNGVYRMFEAEGNSMFPTIPNRSYVVGQFVEDWITGIKDNRIYAVISNEIEDGIIKRCINRIKKYNNLICKSDNRKNYPTQNIDPSTIKEIWEIKLHLNFDLHDPADIYDKINDLESEIQQIKIKLK